MAAAVAMKTSSDINNVIGGINDISLHKDKSKTRVDDISSKDIKKLVDTSKKKVSSLDSQRILSVIDDLILRTEIVTLLPFISENLSRYSVMLGTQLCGLIREYDIVMNLYTKSLSNFRKLERNVKRERKNSTDLPSNDEFNDANTKYQKYSRQLSEIIKNILRVFRTNPAALNSLRNETNERSSECNLLIQSYRGLKEEIFSRLVTTPSEEKDQQRTTIQVLAREKRAMSLIRRMEDEFAVASKEKNDMIQEKNDVIKSLKASIQALEQNAELVNKKILSDAQKAEMSELKTSDNKKASLQQDLIQLKQQHQNNVKKHRESEQALRKRKYKIETEVENWIQNYDNDMSERQNEIDELSKFYNEEQKQLSELEQRFEVLSKTYNEIMEERRIAREKREQAEQELRNMIKAATILQAFWRAYKCRKLLKAKQKKGKKGSKGSSRKKKR